MKKLLVLLSIVAVFALPFTWPASAEMRCPDQDAIADRTQDEQLSGARCRLDIHMESIAELMRDLRPFISRQIRADHITDPFLQERYRAYDYLIRRMTRGDRLLAAAKLLSGPIDTFLGIEMVLGNLPGNDRNIHLTIPELRLQIEAAEAEYALINDLTGVDLRRQGGGDESFSRASRFLDEQNHIEAVALFRESCERQIIHACEIMALAALEGFGMGVDYSLAVRFGMSSCTASLFIHADGCYVAARVHERGLAGGGAQPELARALYWIACNAALREDKACIRLAEMTRRGDGGVRAPEFAVAMFERYCERATHEDHTKLHACGRLAELVDAGVGTSRDRPVALAMAREYCPQGDSFACGLLGILQSNGHGVERDDVAARENTLQGCRADHDRSCHVFAVLHETARGGQEDMSMARAGFTRACELGFRRSCVGEARLMFFGDGGPQDINQAIQRFDELCEENLATACFNLGVIYTNGETVQQNLMAAHRYFVMGCQAGYQPSCDRVGQE